MGAHRLLCLAVALSLAALVGCDGATDTSGGDVCDRARALFAACGVTLPLLSGAPCSGVVRDAAQCVTDQASNCDDLATIATRLDGCASQALDDGGLVPPAENLDLPPSVDAAPLDAAVADNSASAALDAPAPTVDGADAEAADAIPDHDGGE